MTEAEPELSIDRVGPEAAAEVLAIVRTAFAARPVLDPPADAMGETEATMKDRLATYGGLLARLDDEPVGALVMDPDETTMWLRRFAVLPGRQGHGIAHKMVTTVARLAGADGYEDLAIVAREELPRTVRFWDRQGFREIDRTPPYVRMHRPLRTYVLEVLDADAMRELGRRLAGQLRAGDLLVLTGELGAGKTTFTQGVGAGLGVRGEVTSPTFVIARVHPPVDPSAGGPELVHVDAYRLGGVAELDDLDLDTDLDDAVTVVEWGEGLAEGLAESRLEVRIVRALADEPPLDDPDEPEDADPRRIEITPIGPRWHSLDVEML